MPSVGTSPCAASFTSPFGAQPYIAADVTSALPPSTFRNSRRPIFFSSFFMVSIA